MCPTTAQVYEGGRERKPPHPWHKMFARSGCMPLPAPLAKSLNRLDDGNFRGRTPQSGRPSIMAARALLNLHSTRRWAEAPRMWLTVVLRPQTVVRNANDVFLVLAQGRFAARAWLGTKVDETAEHTYFAFDFASKWVWLHAVDVEEWVHLDITWTRTPRPGDAPRFGYVAAQVCRSDSAAHIPAAVDALLHHGPHRLIRPDRRALCQELEPRPRPDVQAEFQYRGEESEAALIRRLMHEHPCLEACLGQLSAWWKADAARNTRRKRDDVEGSGSEPGSTDSDKDPAAQHCALTLAALDGLDEENAQEFRKDLTAVGDLTGPATFMGSHTDRNHIDKELCHPRTLACRHTAAYGSSLGRWNWPVSHFIRGARCNGSQCTYNWVFWSLGSRGLRLPGLAGSTDFKAHGRTRVDAHVPQNRQGCSPVCSPHIGLGRGGVGEWMPGATHPVRCSMGAPVCAQRRWCSRASRHHFDIAGGSAR